MDYPQSSALEQNQETRAEMHPLAKSSNRWQIDGLIIDTSDTSPGSFQKQDCESMSSVQVSYFPIYPGNRRIGNWMDRTFIPVDSFTHFRYKNLECVQKTLSSIPKTFPLFPDSL